MTHSQKEPLNTTSVYDKPYTMGQTLCSKLWALGLPMAVCIALLDKVQALPGFEPERLETVYMGESKNSLFEQWLYIVLLRMARERLEMENPEHCALPCVDKALLEREEDWFDEPRRYVVGGRYEVAPDYPVQEV